MKAILLFLIVFAVASSAFAQRVPSDCTAPDSVLDLYRADAAWHVLYGFDPRNFDIDPALRDSIRIPQERIDSFLRPLIAVYNALPSFPSDTVFMVYDIHHYRSPVLTRIILSIDTGASWAKNLNDGKTPCGYRPIDSLMDLYQLAFDTSDEYQSNAYTIVLKARFPLNMVRLSEVCDSVPGVLNAYYRMVGDGNWLQEKIDDTTFTVIYSYGWGDCPAGCIDRAYWKFTVFADCSVRFEELYGSALPFWEVNTSSTPHELLFYPNPVTDKLIVESQPNSKIEISDITGRSVRTINTQSESTEIFLKDIPAGVYFINVKEKSGAFTSAKFIKQ